MFELKPLSREAIPAALEKATRYRLLNEPAEAESICLDVLRADPDHQQALVILLLALTDRFGKGYGVSDTQAQELLPRLLELFREAMTWFEKAEKLRPAGNDDALLRWNTCARIITRNKLGPRPPEDGPLSLE